MKNEDTANKVTWKSATEENCMQLAISLNNSVTEECSDSATLAHKNFVDASSTSVSNNTPGEVDKAENVSHNVNKPLFVEPPSAKNLKHEKILCVR